MENIKTSSNFVNKNRKKLIIGSIIVLVLLGIFGLYKYMDEKNEKEQAHLSNDSLEETLDFPNASSLASYQDFKHWEASIFSIHAYDSMRQNYKRAIVKIFMDNKYTKTGGYFLTKIENRGKNIFAFGNFTGVP